MWPHYCTQDVHRTPLLQLSLAYQNRIVCTFACHRPLRSERTAVCRVSLPSASLLPAKLSLEESRFPDLFFLRNFWGFARVFREPARTFLSMLLVVHTFLLCTDSLCFWIFCHLQICFVIGDALKNFLSNARRKILLEFVLACSNIRNVFSLLVNTVQTHRFGHSMNNLSNENF